MSSNHRVIQLSGPNAAQPLENSRYASVRLWLGTFGDASRAAGLSTDRAYSVDRLTGGRERRGTGMVWRASC
jgi:hypothetical protein